MSACAAFEKPAPAPLAVPATEARAEHRAGTPLGGVEGPGAADRIDASDAMTLAIRARWSERALRLGDALTSRARLVSAERGGEAVESGSRLAHEARVARAAAAIERAESGRAVELAYERLALPRGVTASLSLVSEDLLATSAGAPARKELRLEVGRSRADGSIAVALVLEDVVAPRGTNEDEEDRRPPSPELRRESILLEDAPRIGEPLSIELPRPFRGGQAEALVLELELSAGADREDLERCLADARAAELRAGERTAWIGSSEARGREIEAAWKALESRTRRRAALVLLAARSGAELCGDLALSADDEALGACVEAIGGGTQPDSLDLGWSLERGAALFLASRAAERPLDPELEAAVLRRAGELGRSPAALADLAERSADLDEFRARIVDENRVLLEDSKPGARVRAYDWLAARGLAPRGYDPLGTREERRAALDAAEAEAEGGR